MNRVQTAEYFKEYLLRIYTCKVPFELFVIDKKPRTKMGAYIHTSDKHRIRIYSKWRSACPLEEIAIHEYAPHIHETEKGGIFGRGANKSHGEIFWRIYSALMARAQIKGCYHDELIEDILTK